MKKRKKATSEVSKRFLNTLSFFSILGFLGIISETIFAKYIGNYIEAAWLMTIGAGMLIETQMDTLKSIRKGMNSTNFTQLITTIIGTAAILSGVFSLPEIEIINPGFLAIKGLVSVIAIVMIIVQTWVVD